MEAGSSRSGGMPQVRCSASASQNVPGVRYLQRPRSQGRQVCGSGQVNSFVSSREGSIASLPLLLSGSFIRFYGRCCTPRRRPIDKAASLVKYTMHMVFLLGAGDHFCVAKVLLQKENTILTDGVFFFGAGDEARTRYLDLGKVALYQMSYARKRHHYCSAYGASGRGRTGDTRIFSPLLYQLSYRGIWRPRRGSNPRPPA